MNKLFTNFLLVTFATFAITACKKHKHEDPTPATPKADCLVKEIWSEDSIDVLLAEYEDGKPVEFQYVAYGEVDLTTTYNYDKDKIVAVVKIGTNGLVRDSVKYFLGSNGHVEKEISIYYDLNDENPTNLYDTITYQYNSDGYMVKKISRQVTVEINTNNSTSQEYEYVYIIQNGNIVSESMSNTGAQDKRVINYEYYTDKENNTQINYIDSDIVNLPFFGKTSKNLMKKATVSGQNDVTNYVYELDKNGYVTRMTATEDDDGDKDIEVFNFSYTCK